MTYNYAGHIASKGSKVQVHYVGSFEDGTQFDNSRVRGEPLEFEIGSGRMIPGFDEAVKGMKVGETKEITLAPEQAYGEFQEKLVRTFPQDGFPEDLECEVGDMVQVPTTNGAMLPAKVEQIENSQIILNFNHPLAGLDLNFQIELIKIVG